MHSDLLRPMSPSAGGTWINTHMYDIFRTIGKPEFAEGEQERLQLA